MRAAPLKSLSRRNPLVEHFGISTEEIVIILLCLLLYSEETVVFVIIRLLLYDYYVLLPKAKDLSSARAAIDC
jgi:hypothetical protein